MNIRTILSTAILICCNLSPSVGALAQSLSASTPTQLSVAPDGAPGDGCSDEVVLSPNSGIAAFTSASANLVGGDTNQNPDIFVRAADGSITRQSLTFGRPG